MAKRRYVEPTTAEILQKYNHREIHPEKLINVFGDVLRCILAKKSCKGLTTCNRFKKKQ